MQPADDPDFDLTSRAGDTLNRLRDWFDAVAELPPAEREAWLVANVADEDERIAVRRLLAVDANEGFLDMPVGEQAARLAFPDAASAALVSRRIGAFRVVRQLGQGGMAAVFLGERVDADFAQQVAIKLLRRGLFSELEQRLFQRERRVLASLDHPRIARLIDGGVTDAGIPYLVMEFVDGVPITEHAQRCDLDTGRRMRLFVEVCRAVEGAHRMLIVHRDIKPSNILVTADGEPKLLDFGIAKLIEEDTEGTAGTMGIFTPGYAAPEQVQGGTITTATDVYALGVLLHEMLLGRRPDVNAGSEPRRPSSLSGAGNALRSRDAAPLQRQLRGDLDNILLKALEREPSHRYASAGALADDIERHLDGRPVVAHPPTRWYRTRKFIRRHRGGVSVTAILVPAMLASLALALWQAHVARNEARRANTVRDFVIELFDTARAHLPREQKPTPQALVEQAQRRIVEANLDAATRADVLRTLGEVDLSLDEFASAGALFDEAASAAAAAGEARGERLARVLHAEAQQKAGRNAEAIAEIDRRLDSLRASADPALPRALDVLSDAELATAAHDKAIAHRREAVDAVRLLSGADGIDSVAAKFALGGALAGAQRYTEAIAELKPAIARWQELHGVEDDRYVAATESLAVAEDGVGDRPASEKDFRELLALKRRIYEAPHDVIARTLRDLGSVLVGSEKYAEARALFEEALAMQNTLYGGDHAEIAETRVEMGYADVMQQRYASGDEHYRAAITICERGAFRTDACLRARQNLGMSLYRQQRYEDARTALTGALGAYRDVYGADHPSFARPLGALANVETRLNHPEEALRLCAEALALLERDSRGASREAVLIRSTRAEALWRAGRKDEALREYDTLLSAWQRIEPRGKSRTIWWLAQKAQVLSELGRPKDARKTAEAAIALVTDPAELATATKKLLREQSGRADLYPDAATPPR
ncbi:MAG: serine/threonine-protein kinase [Rudaea sp.]|uniref:protein kinase domain-containing protein n=1 Tax=Rudaea sp. TaxID=2136325 RepID=UPI0039E30D67